MGNPISKLTMPNSTTYDIVSSEDVIIYLDSSLNNLYVDESCTTQITASWLESKFTDNSKHLWVVYSSYNRSIPVNYTNNLENGGEFLISYLDVEEGTYHLFTIDSNDNVSSETGEIVSANVELHFVKQREFGDQDFEDFLEIVYRPGGEAVQSMIEQTLQSGDTDAINELWTYIIAECSCAAGVSETLAKAYFRYVDQTMGEGDTADFAGSYSPVSLTQVIYIDTVEGVISGSDDHIYSQPFYINGSWKRAVIQRAETQVSTTHYDLDITLEDYSGGGSVTQLHAVWADTEEYPELSDQLIIDPYIPIEDITDAIEDGEIITVDFTDYDGRYYGGIVLQSYHNDGDPTLSARGLYIEQEEGLLESIELHQEETTTAGGTTEDVLLASRNSAYVWRSQSAGYSDLSSTAYNVASRIYYGTCATAASTAAKVASCIGGFSLNTGAVVFLNFSYKNTATTPTLNVNSTGAKSIAYFADGTQITTDIKDLIVAGTNRFTYNGTYWVIDANTDKWVSQTNTTTNSDYRLLFSGNANDTTQNSISRKSTYLKFNPSTKVLTVGTGGSITVPTLTASSGISTNSITTQNGDTIDATQNGLSVSPNTAFIVDKDSNSLTVNSNGVTISTPANEELEVDISSDYIYLTSPGYGGEIGIDDTGAYLSNTRSILSASQGRLYGTVNVDDQYDGIELATFNSNGNTKRSSIELDQGANINLMSSSSLHLNCDMIYAQSGYGSYIAAADDEFSIYQSYNGTISQIGFALDGTGIDISTGSLTLNEHPIRPTVIIYFGPNGLYKDAGLTTLYTTGDYLDDLVGSNANLFVDAGNSSYPATYQYGLSGSTLTYARITCIVTESNTIYQAQAFYSTGAETFTVTSEYLNKIPSGGTTGQVLTKTSNSDYDVSWQTASGGGSSPITGSTNPTTSTTGEVGQMYLNTTTEIMYVCTYATSGTYHWKPITFESAESQVG